VIDQVFRILQPEVAGSLGEQSVLDYSSRPPAVVKLDYEFQAWLGDDLVEEAGNFIVTARLKAALEEFGATGCSFDNVVISKAEGFDELHPNVELPQWFWMKVHGTAGVDDAGLTEDRSLVVNERFLDFLKRFKISHCIIRRRPFKLRKS
jgi:hypothetical protein